MTRALSIGCVLVAAALVAPSASQQPSSRPAPAAATHAAGEVQELPAAKDSVKFAVIGDTGTGGRQQYQIAAKLAEARTRFPFEFVVMLGDNMYGGESPADFVKKFEAP